MDFGSTFYLSSPCWTITSTHFVKTMEDKLTQFRPLQITPIHQNVFGHLSDILPFLSPVSHSRGHAYLSMPFTHSFQYSQNDRLTGGYAGQCYPTIFLSSQSSFVCLDTSKVLFTKADCILVVKSLTGHTLPSFPDWQNSIYFLTSSPDGKGLPLFKQLTAPDKDCLTAVDTQISSLIVNIFFDFVLHLQPVHLKPLNSKGHTFCCQANHFILEKARLRLLKTSTTVSFTKMERMTSSVITVKSSSAVKSQSELMLLPNIKQRVLRNLLLMAKELKHLQL